MGLFISQPSASLSLIPAISSSLNLPPPSVGAAQRQNFGFSRERSPHAVSEANMSPEEPRESPVLMSNNEIFTMLDNMNRQMAQQQQSHQNLMREIEGIRSEIRRTSGSAHSVLRPRILNSDNSRSLTDRQETIIPATTTVTTEGVTPRFQADTFQDPNGIFADPGNLNTFQD